MGLYDKPPIEGKSFGILAVNNSFRQWCYHTIYHKWTIRIIIILIWISTLNMLLIPRNSNVRTFYERSEGLEKAALILDYILTSLFLVEILFKLVALGVWQGSSTFFRTPANILDFVVVVASVVGNAVNVLGIGALRAFRALRPLRAIPLLNGVQGILDSLVQSLPMLASNLSFFFFFYILFAVMGLEFYGNSYRRKCSANTPPYEEILPSTWCKYNHTAQDKGLFGLTCGPHFLCLEHVNPNHGLTHFDHIGGALLVLFQVTSQWNWASYMWPLMDSEEEYATGVWFMIVMLVMSFVVVNLFVAVIVTVFSNISAEQGSAFTSMEQRTASPRNRDKSPVPSTALAARPTLVGPADNSQTIVVEDLGNEVLDIPPQHQQRGSIDDQLSEQHITALSALNRSRGTVQSQKLPPSQNIAIAYVQKIVFTDWFELAVSLLILLNVCIQATEHKGQPDYYSKFLGVAEDVFLVLFLVEMLLKALAYPNFSRWFQNKWNVFDAFLVFLSLIGKAIGGSANLSFFRSIRMLRVIRFIKRLRELQNILMCMVNGILPIVNLLITICIFILIFAILGLQLFAGELGPWDERLSPRLHFDDFGTTCLTLFIILTGDNWMNPMYNVMHRIGVIYCAYFIVYYIGSTWILLNMFTAVVLENFHILSDEDQQPSLYQKATRKIKAWCMDRCPKLCGSNQDDLNITTDSKPSSSQAPSRPQSPTIQKFEQMNLEQALALLSTQTHVNKLAKKAESVASIKLRTTSIHGSSENLHPEERVKTPFWKKHLFLFEPHGKVIEVVRALAKSDGFEYFLLFVIVVSTVLMATEPPPDAHRFRQATMPLGLEVSDYVLAVIFTLECVIKIVGLTFVGYIRDAWNRLDFFILISMYAAVLFPVLKFFRLLRSFRPLRLVRRISQLRVIVLALWFSLPAIFHIVFVAMFFFLIFGLFGLGLFLGKFEHCTYASATGLADCDGSFVNSWGILANKAWLTPPANFDNIGRAFLTLFEVASLSDWATIMYQATDIQAINEQPKFNNSAVYTIYFIVFIIVGSFFLVNIFIGIIMEHIDKQRGVLFMTEHQKQWVDSKRILMLAKPPTLRAPPNNHSCEAQSYKIGTHRVTDNFILACIVLNILMLCTQTTTMTRGHQLVVKYGNLVFLVIYVVEIILKIIAYTVRLYFKDPWNIFDFVAVALACVFTIPELIEVDSIFIIGIARMVRILRIFRLVRRIRPLQTFFDTLITSLPSILNVSFLMVIMGIIYAYVGKNIFAAVRDQLSLNRSVNFRHFRKAVWVLYRNLTLDDWNNLMHNCWIKEKQCTMLPFFNDCGTRLGAIVYFLSYYVVGSYIIFNLVIAIILDNFAQCFSGQQLVAVIGSEDVEAFKQQWKVIDPTLTGSIPRYRVKELVQNLIEAGSRLGLGAQTKLHFMVVLHELTMKWKRRNIITIKKPTGGIKFTFAEVLLVLSKYAMNDEFLSEEEVISRQAVMYNAVVEYSMEKLLGFLHMWAIMRKRRLIKQGRIPKDHFKEIHVSSNKQNKKKKPKTPPKEETTPPLSADLSPPPPLPSTSPALSPPTTDPSLSPKQSTEQEEKPF